MTTIFTLKDGKLVNTDCGVAEAPLVSTAMNSALCRLGLFSIDQIIYSEDEVPVLEKVIVRRPGPDGLYISVYPVADDITRWLRQRQRGQIVQLVLCGKGRRCYDTVMWGAPISGRDRHAFQCYEDGALNRNASDTRKLVTRNLSNGDLVDCMVETHGLDWGRRNVRLWYDHLGNIVGVDHADLGECT